MNMWVFRVPNAFSGKPKGSCPTTLNQGALKTGLTTGTVSHLTYDGSIGINFILEELFQHHRLRQGWGIPTLDLRLPDNAWIENFIIASNRYWGVVSNCAKARGRLNILSRMVQMKINDIIFLPNVKDKVVDHDYFTVVTVKNPYYFEDRSQEPNTWEKDFAHVIEVKKIETYRFSGKTLPKSIFGAPFMHAIDQIGPSYKTYNTFEQFVKDSY
ncbi:MAG: hypothetical protein DRR16_19955 [Candidatus Parabeggiatoa sp. nov. 3]|nr:MAG: hypothetical protein DRR00_23790 [Gammaproteobacteria bacterium]RKZ50359.1 MAG: hypothetical protein DRQ99_33930 [Gammaproteobacteria bacterium]RKZ82329.1 MAG: hypothetical protein DRR16_19955 [Gammaproteobacteria bacterium]